jgi:hypothetical protein
LIEEGQLSRTSVSDFSPIAVQPQHSTVFHDLDSDSHSRKSRWSPKR